MVVIKMKMCRPPHVPQFKFDSVHWGAAQEEIYQVRRVSPYEQFFLYDRTFLILRCTAARGSDKEPLAGDYSCM